MEHRWPLSNVRRSVEVADVSEPNLMREQFPYHEPPKVLFDGIDVPTALPDEIIITDTTFRDGQQARAPLEVSQIVRLFDLLHRLSGPNGVIRKSEFFLYGVRDREAVAGVLSRGYRFPEVTGWVRAKPEDLRLVREAGLKETGILTSCSDYHIFMKLGWTRRKALDNYLAVVSEALSHGLRVRCHLEDLTRADVYGFVVPLAQRLMGLADQAHIPVILRLCDTMGYGVPYPGAVLPRSVPRLVHTMTKEAGVPTAWLEWHGHNDFYKVLINASTAWLYGCASANGTLLGYGERTGNTPIEGLVFEYAGLMGSLNGMDTTAIAEVAEFMEHECQYPIPAAQPFVGRAFNATSAGIHADGAMKNEEIYNIFDTGALLNRPPAVNVTDRSGTAGVALWIRQHTGRTLPKEHPSVEAIHTWVNQQYAAGRTTAISDEEMADQVKRHFQEVPLS
ncbi:MAG TPA: 2-isopropylmalate synthase [bacterium]|nr:2-isopropylmalate synthase [bacterium]